MRIFDKGQCLYNMTDLEEIRDYCKQQTDALWEEVLRFEDPHKYYVDLSEALWSVKDKLLKEYMAY